LSFSVIQEFRMLIQESRKK